MFVVIPNKMGFLVPFKLWIVSQAGVSPRLIKYHENYLISTDDVNTRS